LNAEVARILQTLEVRKVFEHEGAEPVGNSPEQFAAIIKSETAKWAKLVKAAGIKGE
jgi:tripartite-type tricarboxylate transporter receptor subunit TctC